MVAQLLYNNEVDALNDAIRAKARSCNPFRMERERIRLGVEFGRSVKKAAYVFFVEASKEMKEEGHLASAMTLEAVATKIAVHDKDLPSLECLVQHYIWEKNYVAQHVSSSVETTVTVGDA